MSWPDFVIIAIIVLFALQGFRVGLIGGLFHIIATVAAFVLSVMYYPLLGKVLAQYIGISQQLGVVGAFFLLLFILDAVFGYVIQSLYFRLLVILSVRPVALVNRFLGIVPQVIIGIAFTTLFLMLTILLPVSEQLKRVVRASWYGTHVLPRAIAYEPFVKSLISRLPAHSLVYIVPRPYRENDVVTLSIPPSVDFAVDETAENKMLEFVNRERTSRGLHALRMDSRIRTVARAYSLEMFENSFFSHHSLVSGTDPVHRLIAGHVPFVIAGENLAYAPTVEIAHQGLMNSPGHRVNILSSEYNRVGIGAISGGLYGIMFTQNFTD